MKLKIVFSALFLGMILLFSSVSVNAQCALCKRAAEGNVSEKGGDAGKGGLNKGILYLLSVPYLIGGIGLLAWYSERRKKRVAVSSTDIS